MMSDAKATLHCTAKFCGFQPKFPKKNKPEESVSLETKTYMKKIEKYLGQVQPLKIVGVVFSKETVGYRVQLDQEQIEMYDQIEDLNKLSRQYGPVEKKSKNVQDDYKETVTIEEIENDFVCDFARKVNKAHITVATAPGVKPVNTGLDLLQVVQAEKLTSNSDEDSKTFSIPESQDILKYCEDNLWVVYLKDALKVQTIFTGYY